MSIAGKSCVSTAVRKLRSALNVTAKPGDWNTVGPRTDIPTSHSGKLTWLRENNPFKFWMLILFCIYVPIAATAITLSFFGHPLDTIGVYISFANSGWFLTVTSVVCTRQRRKANAFLQALMKDDPDYLTYIKFKP